MHPGSVQWLPGRARRRRKKDQCVRRSGHNCVNESIFCAGDTESKRRWAVRQPFGGRGLVREGGTGKHGLVGLTGARRVGDGSGQTALRVRYQHQRVRHVLHQTNKSGGARVQGPLGGARYGGRLSLQEGRALTANRYGGGSEVED